MTEIIIRSAKCEDCKAIQALIQELANYEKMPDEPKIDYKVLERDGFGESPLFFCDVATYGENIIGYTIFYYTYSTWYGKAMYLEDIYVTPEFRGRHIGSKLLKAVAKKTMQDGCCRLDFSVLNWNPAKEFYKKLGAKDITIKEQWHHYRFSNTDLKKLISDI